MAPSSRRPLSARRSRNGGPAEAIATRARRPWNDEVEQFLRTKADEGQVGEAWLRRMRWELVRCPGLLERFGSGPGPDSIRDLEPAHLDALRTRAGWEKSTVALHFAALRQFARWGANPLATRAGPWRLPSGHPSRRRWLSRAQFIRLLASAPGRAKVLVALEGLNGLRRVEVLRLRARDVLLGEGCLSVIGKGRNGGKWRKIPMHPVVGRLLRPMVRGLPPDDRLFAMSRSGADGLLQRAVERADPDRSGLRVSHHDLRRTFGRIAYGAGMDLVQLKNLLGHSSIEMTVHYIGLDADQMRAGLRLVRIRA